MIYNIFSPSQELQSVVKQYVVINSLDGIDSLLFLPNGCNFIVFNRGFEGYTKVYNEDGEFLIPKNYSVSAKSNKVNKFVLSEANNSIDVKFPMILAELTPIGFYKLFNTEASELNNGYKELEQNIVETYFKDLYRHKNIEEELKYLNKTLGTLHNSQDNIHMPIQDVIEKITDSYHFEVTVENLLEEFNCSRSTMERDFKKFIGLTPKNFIFISKFCKTVLAYIDDDYTFTELEYLYNDHSYMNAVFKKFLGVSPSVILNEVRDNNIRIHQMKKLDD